jgi:hypothetical protein
MKKKRPGKTSQEEAPNLFGSKLDLERLEAKFGWKERDIVVVSKEEGEQIWKRWEEKKRLRKEKREKDSKN